MSVFCMNYYCNFVRLGQRSALLHRVQFSDPDRFWRGIANTVYLRNYQLKGAYDRSEGRCEGLPYFFSRAYNGQRWAEDIFFLPYLVWARRKSLVLLLLLKTFTVISTIQFYLEILMNCKSRDSKQITATYCTKQVLYFIYKQLRVQHMRFRTLI